MTYDSRDDTLRAFGKTAQLPAEEGTLDLRFLIDRTSIEIFALGGRIVMSFCFVPDVEAYGLSLNAEGSPVTVGTLEVKELKSIW